MVSEIGELLRGVALRIDRAMHAIQAGVAGPRITAIVNGGLRRLLVRGVGAHACRHCIRGV